MASYTSIQVQTADYKSLGTVRINGDKILVRQNQDGTVWGWNGTEGRKATANEVKQAQAKIA